MHMTPSTEFAVGLTADLQAFLKLCEETLALAMCENLALTGPSDYQVQEFCQRRKDLLPGLESALFKLRSRRKLGQQTGQLGHSHSEETKTLFQVIQNLLMKVLLLDRENQQALLRRGLVPATHLPAAGGQQPHFVAGLYRRYAGI